MLPFTRIDSPPPQPPAQSAIPAPAPASAPAPVPRGFRSVNVPTQPRASAPQSKPDTNVLERDAKRARVEDDVVEEKPEPVVVLEEERDPEKVLEERRKKREEIMAKFRANGGKPAVSAAFEGKEAAGTGAESVTSTGMKTGMRTAHSASGEPEHPIRTS